MIVTTNDNSVTIFTADSAGQKVPLVDYLTRTYGDKETNSNITVSYKKKGDKHTVTGMSKYANFIQPYDIFEQFMDNGCELLKVINGEQDVFYEFRPQGVPDFDNPFAWNTYQSAMARAVDNIVHPMIRVHVSVQIGNSVTIEEGFHYKWCTNGAFTHKAYKRMSLGYGELKHIPEKLANLSLPKLLPVLDERQTHQLMQGETVTEWTPERKQAVKSVFNKLLKQGRKEAPDFNLEDYLYHVRDAITAFYPQEGSFGLKWLNKNLYENLDLLPYESLHKGDVEQIVTNAINMEHENARFNVSNYTRAQRSIVDKLAVLMSGVN